MITVKLKITPNEIIESHWDNLNQAFQFIEIAKRNLRCEVFLKWNTTNSGAES